MKKDRVAIPASIKKTLKDEANHCCTICEAGPYEGRDLHIHHVDLDPSNNSLDNLQVVCSACHWELHRDTKWDDEHHCWDTPHARANRELARRFAEDERVTITIDVTKDVLEQLQQVAAAFTNGDLGLALARRYLWNELHMNAIEEFASEKARVSA